MFLSLCYWHRREVTQMNQTQFCMGETCWEFGLVRMKFTIFLSLFSSDSWIAMRWDAFTSHINATVKIQLGLVALIYQLSVFTSIKVQLHYCRMKVDSVSTGISMKTAEVSMIFTPSSERKCTASKSMSKAVQFACACFIWNIHLKKLFFPTSGPK